MLKGNIGLIDLPFIIIAYGMQFWLIALFYKPMKSSSLYPLPLFLYIVGMKLAMFAFFSPIIITSIKNPPHSSHFSELPLYFNFNACRS